MRADRSLLTLLLACLCGILAGMMLSSSLHGAGVALEKRWVNRASVYQITADLNDPEIRVDIGVAAKGISHSESFLSMVTRHSPLAAVTGTYFDTRTLIPTGTIVVGGKVIYDNAIGTAVRFLKSEGLKTVDAGTPQKVPIPKRYSVEFRDLKEGEGCEWGGVECGLRTGPRLLSGGLYALNARREGFKHPGLFGSRSRVAMGVTAANKLLLVAVRTPVTFARLAGIMKSLGAVDAVCLDGGTSSAMYYQGRLICRPGRALTNIIEIRREPAAEQVAKRSKPLPGHWDLRKYAALMSIQAFDGRPMNVGQSVRRPSGPALWAQIHDDQAAALVDPMGLRRAKGRGAFAPVNRA